MSRFAKLSLKKFATLKRLETLMEELMILEGRLEQQDPRQYLNFTELLQPQLADKLQSRSAQTFPSNNAELCHDQF